MGLILGHDKKQFIHKIFMQTNFLDTSNLWLVFIFLPFGIPIVFGLGRKLKPEK
jgi:uncharacterized membrane protein